MKYVGIQSQISSNNTKSMLLLVSFPIILLGMTWVFLATINYFSTGYYDQAGYFVNQLDADSVNWTFTCGHLVCHRLFQQHEDDPARHWGTATDA